MRIITLRQPGSSEYNVLLEHDGIVDRKFFPSWTEISLYGELFIDAISNAIEADINSGLHGGSFIWNRCRSGEEFIWRIREMPELDLEDRNLLIRPSYLEYLKLLVLAEA